MLKKPDIAFETASIIPQQITLSLIFHATWNKRPTRIYFLWKNQMKEKKAEIHIKMRQIVSKNNKFYVYLHKIPKRDTPH